VTFRIDFWEEVDSVVLLLLLLVVAAVEQDWGLW